MINKHTDFREDVKKKMNPYEKYFCDELRK